MLTPTGRGGEKKGRFFQADYRLNLDYTQNIVTLTLSNEGTWDSLSRCTRISASATPCIVLKVTEE